MIFVLKYINNFILLKERGIIMEEMVNIVKKFMEMIKRIATDSLEEIKICTFFGGKTMEIKAKMHPKAMGFKIIMDNIYESILFIILILSLFTKVNKKPLKVVFVISYISEFITNILINKAAENEIKSNIDSMESILDLIKSK